MWNKRVKIGMGRHTQSGAKRHRNSWTLTPKAQGYPRKANPSASADWTALAQLPVVHAVVQLRANARFAVEQGAVSSSKAASVHPHTSEWVAATHCFVVGGFAAGRKVDAVTPDPQTVVVVQAFISIVVIGAVVRD